MLSLTKIWSRLSEAASEVRGVPFVVGLLALCALLLDGTPQGLDLADSSAESTGQVVWLFLSSTILGVEAWFWTRRIIDENYGQARAEWPAEGFLIWTPRILGLAPFVIIAVAVIRFHGIEGAILAAGLIVAGLLLFWVLVQRTKWLDQLRSSARASVFDTKAMDRTAQLFGAGSFVLAFALMLGLIIDPVSFPRWIGPIAVVFIGIAGIIPVLASSLHFGRAWRAPVLTGLIIYLVVVSLWLDNHAIGRRAFYTSEGVAPVDASLRMDLKTAFDKWYAQAPHPTSGGPTPIILVAAEGGASRAGYWAAENLGLLQEKSLLHDRFASSLFAISSVSGGSVGATAFISQLHDNARPQGGYGFAEAIKLTAAGDFLSPVLAGLLFPDLLQRAIPIPLLPDRAEALERGFERSWSDHCAKVQPCDEALWRKPFLQLWKNNPGWVPSLLINGSRQEDGRRVITSNLIIDPNVFSNSLDFYSLVGHDISVSTAIHNGARFPLVSPGGTFVTSSGPQGHILDGGYIDGHGVLTLSQLARAVMAIARSENIALRPIIIELNNDSDTDTASAELVRGFYTPGSAAGLLKSPTHLFASDLLGPIDGLKNAGGGNGTTGAVAFSREIQLASSPDAVRSGATPAPGAERGVDALAALKDQAQAQSPWGDKPTFRMLHLCKIKGRGMAMDWAVSHASKRVSYAATGYDKDGTDPCSNRRTVKQIEADYGTL